MHPPALQLRIAQSSTSLPSAAWNALLAQQSQPTPFMRHEYLAALEASGSATPRTGWAARFFTLWQGAELVAACPLYLKSHSYGEYVFDWAWASAYEQHGVPYYPKAVVAVPFTPVPGTRLMARDAAARQGLVQALCQWCEDEGISSLHVLFASDDDVLTGAREGLMLRHTVQFHWKNVAPTLGTDVSSLPPEGALAALGRPGDGSGSAPTLGTGVSSLPPEGALAALGRPGGGSGAAPTLGTGGFLLPTESVLAAVESHCDSGSAAAGTLAYRDFDDFLAHLTQEKRKKFRQERRRVAEAGVTFRWALGADITADAWNFFYRCYERTYLEHGNPPYLTRAFFQQMADRMPEHWLLFIAEREGRPIASSLIAISAQPSSARGQYHSKYAGCTAYGRYWGALERVDCLHFEACYYQPLAWCIAHGVQRFEGGAQGEHKMARALLPVPATSMHWLAHPAFADAVDRFLAREGAGVEQYLDHLQARSPFRAA